MSRFGNHDVEQAIRNFQSFAGLEATAWTKLQSSRWSCRDVEILMERTAVKDFDATKRQVNGGKLGWRTTYSMDGI